MKRCFFLQRYSLFFNWENWNFMFISWVLKVNFEWLVVLHVLLFLWVELWLEIVKKDGKFETGAVCWLFCLGNLCPLEKLMLHASCLDCIRRD